MSSMATSSDSPSTPSKFTCRLCGSRGCHRSVDRDAANRRAAVRPAGDRAAPRRARSPSAMSACANGARRAEPDDARHIQRAGPKAALLSAADDERIDRRRACARRSRRSLSGRRTCAPVSASRSICMAVDVDRDLAGGLRRIDDGTARRPRARSRRCPRAAGRRRSRCSRPSRRPAPVACRHQRSSAARSTGLRASRDDSGDFGTVRRGDVRRTSSTDLCSIADTTTAGRAVHRARARRPASRGCSTRWRRS